METQSKETHTRIRVEDLKTIRSLQNSIGLSNIADTIHRVLHPQENNALTLIRFIENDYQKLLDITNQFGFSHLGYTIHSILEAQSTTKLVNPDEILKERIPIAILGKSLSGKSRWIKTVLLPSITAYPVLVMDTNGEYPLREIKSIRELNLQGREHVRFVPSQHSLMSTMQVKSIFTELNMQVDIDKEALKNLVLIVEEAQSYKSNWFNGFLYRSRHMVRKMIVVTPQTDCFLGLQSFIVFR